MGATLRGDELRLVLAPGAHLSLPATVLSGEIAAQGLYQGRAAVARDTSIEEQMKTRLCIIFKNSQMTA